MQRRFLRKRGAAGKVSACGKRAEPSQSSLRGASSPERGSFLAAAARFLIAPDTLATELTACALSVTCGDTSPKGRGKDTAGNSLIMPNTLATNVTAWLSLRESWRGSA